MKYYIKYFMNNNIKIWDDYKNVTKENQLKIVCEKISKYNNYKINRLNL